MSKLNSPLSPSSSPASTASHEPLPPGGFDLIIIGGGINGAGIARDAAMRGLKVLLLEKNDFAYGTSSRSTKLIHGGIRYLENFDFKLVWEACHERKILTQIAPQLVHPMPFIIPVYQGDKRPLWLMRLGMTLYDLMAGLKNLAPHRSLSSKKLLEIAPSLKQNGLRGGGVYYDAQTNDARLVLANIQDAARHGAVVKNYTEVLNVISSDAGFAIEARDFLTQENFTFAAPYVINATGPWLDLNLKKWHIAKVLPSQIGPHLRLTKGIHFFIPTLLDEYAILVPATDGRVFFVIPWGEYSLIGTTDTDYEGSPDMVKTTEEDKLYLLKELQRIFPQKNIQLEDIRAEYAGLRPLLATKNGSSKLGAGKVSREYKLEEYTIESKIPGQKSATFLSVVGGKITTYRHLAQIVTNRVMLALKGSHGTCETAHTNLPGSEFSQQNFENFKNEKQKNNAQLAQFSPEIIEHLLNNYGTEIDQVLPYLQQIKTENSPSMHGNERIIPELPILWGELFYAVQHEFVRTAEDFIRRRTDLYLLEKKHPDVPQKITAAVDLFSTNTK